MTSMMMMVMMMTMMMVMMMTLMSSSVIASDVVVVTAGVGTTTTRTSRITVTSDNEEQQKQQQQQQQQQSRQKQRPNQDAHSTNFPAIYTATVFVTGNNNNDDDYNDWNTRRWWSSSSILQRSGLLIQHLDVLQIDCPTRKKKNKKNQLQQQQHQQLQHNTSYYCQFHSLIDSYDEYIRIQDMVDNILFVVRDDDGIESIIANNDTSTTRRTSTSLSSSSTSTSSSTTTSSNTVPSLTFEYNPTLTEEWVVPRMEIRRLYYEGREEEQERKLLLQKNEMTEHYDNIREQQHEQEQQSRHLRFLQGSSTTNNNNKTTTSTTSSSWVPPWTDPTPVSSSTGMPYSFIYGRDCYLDYDGTIQWIQDLIVANSQMTTNTNNNNNNNMPLLQIEWKDIGDSYLKSINNNDGSGHDIYVLTITLAEDPDRNNNNNNVTNGTNGTTATTTTAAKSSTTTSNDDKVPFFLVSSTHPREYAPVELVRRWISSVVRHIYDPSSSKHNKYMSLLHTTKIHWVPHLNPDGRVLAETTQPMRRKNMNYDWDSSGSMWCSDDTYGVDLNRNFPFMWGDDLGSSSDPCSSKSRGNEPGSEPEIQALVSYQKSVFPESQQEQSFYVYQQAHRSSTSSTTDGTGTAAAVDPDTYLSLDEFSSLSAAWGGYDEATTVGVFIDVHSYGNMYIYSWGNLNVQTPNDMSFRAGIGKLETMTASVGVGPGSALYEPASGASDDYSYGVLGAYGMTWEIGSAFHEACDDFESSLEGHFNAFDYLASIAPLPFALSTGPDIIKSSLIFSPSILEYGNDLTVSIEASDGVSVDEGGTTISTALQDVVEIRVYGRHPLVEKDTTTKNIPLWSWTDTDDGFVSTSDSTGSGTVARLETTIPWEEVYEQLGPSGHNTDGGMDPHFLYLQAMDEDGSWGPVTVVTLVVDVSGMPTIAPTTQDVILNATVTNAIVTESSSGQRSYYQNGSSSITTTTTATMTMMTVITILLFLK